MNKFKKKKTMPLTLPVILCICAALFVVGCGDSGTFAGTSEEGNEMAEKIPSSSSADESSSSGGDEESSSSSLKWSSAVSSSSKGVALSSSEVASSSSQKLSSSSQKDNTPNYSSSLSDGKTQTPPIFEQDPNSRSLDSYLKQFKLDSASFDGAVLSAKFDVSESVNPSDPITNPPSASATEFDGPWPHKFVKQNIAALELFFPMAVKEYSDIVNAIKNDSLDAGCGLYMLNIYGDGKAAGFVLADIAKETITVLDVSAGHCESSSGKMERFLFYYCGEIDNRPEIVHVPVENNWSGKCPVLETRDEWVKESSRTP